MNSAVELIINPNILELCRKRYVGHPHGCPNYGVRDGCPPHGPLIHDLIELERPIVAIWVDFDLAKQRKRMLAKHPGWSIRQQECCLYWQGSVMKWLRMEVAEWLRYQADPHLIALYCPEAGGVDVTATMKTAGISLEWPPVKIVRKVTLIGTKKFEQNSPSGD